MKIKADAAADADDDLGNAAGDAAGKIDTQGTATEGLTDDIADLIAAIQGRYHFGG